MHTESSHTPPPVIDGNAAYVACDPAGIGATVDRAMRADGGGLVRHVVVTGDRPEGGARAWCDRAGGWFPTELPYVKPNALRITLAAEGRLVHVSRAASWFGVEPDTEAVAGAMRIMRHVAGIAGARVVASPGRTGLAMADALWRKRGTEWPKCSPEVGELLRATSGQGRFELRRPAGEQHAGRVELVKVDARFQYAALAGRELPIGDPIELAPGAEPDEYAPSWCEVEYVPAGPVAMLGVYQGERDGWAWPLDGRHVTWCSGAELLAARRAGYTVTVRRALVWEQTGRPLAGWASLLVRERDRIDGLPLPAAVREAARAGMRAMLVQAVGMLHGRAPARQCVAAGPADIPPDAQGVRRTGGRWLYELPGTPGPFAHPEWTVALWGVARQRLALQLARQTAPVIGCALDAYYTAGEPVTDPDDGRAGRWRIAGRWSDWSAPAKLSDLYRLGRG